MADGLSLSLLYRAREDVRNFSIRLNDPMLYACYRRYLSTWFHHDTLDTFIHHSTFLTSGLYLHRLYDRRNSLAQTNTTPKGCVIFKHSSAFRCYHENLVIMINSSVRGRGTIPKWNLEQQMYCLPLAPRDHRRWNGGEFAKKDDIWFDRTMVQMQYC